MIVMGSGDEVRVRFDARSLSPVKPGNRRDFLLKVDGWAKDRDANTAFSQTTEPLPFHGMSRYPYPETEHFPNEPAHRGVAPRIPDKACAAANQAAHSAQSASFRQVIQSS